MGTILSQSHLHNTHKKKFRKIWYDIFQCSIHKGLYSLTLCLVLWFAFYGFPPCPTLALRDLISKSFTGGFINQLRTTKFHHRYSHWQVKHWLIFVSLCNPFFPLFRGNQYTPSILILILCMYVCACCRDRGITRLFHHPQHQSILGIYAP